MPEATDTLKRHFILDGLARTERYRSPRRGGGRVVVPRQDRASHGAALLGQIEALRPAALSARAAQVAAGVETGLGLQVEFESFPEIELAFENLARERSQIELLNVRHEETRTCATVFVPDGKLDHFEKLIRDYLAEKRDSTGRARDNRPLLDTIRDIREASLRALWTDDTSQFPGSYAESFWWEIWLPIREDRAETLAAFRERVLAQGIRIAPGDLQFPERTVIVAYASAEQMTRSMVALNNIAELRRAKETADFFDSMPPLEQTQWFDDLRRRTHYSDPNDHAPYVCLLDTGVNNGHPAIAPALDSSDLHTLEPSWGTDDTAGHGTAMAGLALLGNMTALLVGGDPVEVVHRLESVKLLPWDGGNKGDAQHHGYLTVEAVARPEIAAPSRSRVFSMAITARDNRDRGRPSAWSAAVDRLASDSDGYGERPRLLIVSAGNVGDPYAWNHYPDSNDTDGVHDPGQAWNALTVGAFTDLVRITETDATGYTPIASQGGLSPLSTTSLTWQSEWPLKPDLLLEGGNIGKDALSPVVLPSLSLLTTHHKPADRLLTTSNGTSAATALASRMAAQLMAAYPELWPETIRGLMVHSAEWTEEMRRMFLPPTGAQKKSDYQRLVRRCGFGVPDLERALWSASNSLTMVLQERIHPFQREGSKEPTLRAMHLYRLPWPQDVLEHLGETPVEMRVTLSYFIEPSPSQRGTRSRYRYESHGLRFDVKRPVESVDEFRSRINAAARDEEESTNSSGDDPAWLIGKQIRHKGSLHSDTWKGSAVDLASRGTLAVYPALGWWKTRPRLERYDRATRYALLVSIRAPEVDVDIYSAVASQVGVPIEIET